MPAPTLVVAHAQDCPCPIEDCWAIPKHALQGQAIQGEYQTRANDGGLVFWPTISSAMADAAQNPKIEKISWTEAITGERVQLVRHAGFSDMSKEDVWVYEPIDRGNGDVV